MLKAGIFVDAENVMRNGGWGLRYDVLREFCQAQGATVVRANAYLAVDREREDSDAAYRERKVGYRSRLRACGFKLVLKEVKRFRNEDGEVVTKANADLDLAVDALLQSRNLDYVLIVSGDGDFVRPIVALQDSGCRVDVIGFHSVSGDLVRAADNFCSGFLLPGLVPCADPRRLRGHLHFVDEPRYYGYLTVYRSLKLTDVSTDIFLHGNELTPRLSNDEFARLRGSRQVIEFSLDDNNGKPRAVNAAILSEERPRQPSRPSING